MKTFNAISGPSLHVERVGEWDYSYRVWCNRYIPFDTFPVREPVRPTLVTLPNRSVAVMSGFGIDGFELRMCSVVDGVTTMRWDPVLFGHYDDALRYAYEFGSLGWMVYERYKDKFSAAIANALGEQGLWCPEL